MKKTMSIISSIVVMSSFIGCGNGSLSNKGISELGWNGVFIDSGVQGLNWECGGVKGLTLAGGFFGTCPEGSSVTFSFGELGEPNTISLGTVAETSNHVFTPRNLAEATPVEGESETDVANRTNVIAATFLSLDGDGDPSENGGGIVIDEDTVVAFQNAVANNGGEVTAENLNDIFDEVVVVIPTIVAVTPDDAAIHLEASAVEIIEITVEQPARLTGTSKSS